MNIAPPREGFLKPIRVSRGKTMGAGAVPIYVPPPSSVYTAPLRLTSTNNSRKTLAAFSRIRVYNPEVLSHTINSTVFGTRSGKADSSHTAITQELLTAISAVDNAPVELTQALYYDYGNGTTDPLTVRSQAWVNTSLIHNSTVQHNVGQTEYNIAVDFTSITLQSMIETLKVGAVDETVITEDLDDYNVNTVATFEIGEDGEVTHVEGKQTSSNLTGVETVPSPIAGPEWTWLPEWDKDLNTMVRIDLPFIPCLITPVYRPVNMTKPATRAIDYPERIDEFSFMLVKAPTERGITFEFKSASAEFTYTTVLSSTVALSWVRARISTTLSLENTSTIVISVEHKLPGGSYVVMKDETFAAPNIDEEAFTWDVYIPKDTAYGSIIDTVPGQWEQQSNASILFKSHLCSPNPNTVYLDEGVTLASLRAEWLKDFTCPIDAIPAVVVVDPEDEESKRSNVYQSYSIKDR